MLNILRNVWLPLVLIHFLLSGSVWADTNVSGLISSDTRWTIAGSPYIVTSTVQVYGTNSSPTTLTIDPGVTVKFAAGAGLQVSNGAANPGSLIAKGTSDNRITFTRNAASGNWGNISFQTGTLSTAAIEYADIQYSSDIYIYTPINIKNSTIKDITGSYGIYLSAANPVLENVTITTNSSYGMYLGSSSPIVTGGSLTNTNSSGQGVYGSGSPIISNYNVLIANSTAKYGLYLTSSSATLSVTNSTIGNGLYLGTGAFIPTITGNTFSNSDNSPPHAGANIIGQILDSNTFNGLTAAGRIEVAAELVNRDVQWKKHDAPYVIFGPVQVYGASSSTPTTLSIEPGVTVKFAAGAGLQVSGSAANPGSLIAKGTSDNRITFTRNAASGNWGNISFQTGTLSTAVIEYADIQYSSGISINSASPALRNSTITDVAGYISLNSSSSILENITITNNGSYGIYLGTSSPTITGGSLTNTNSSGHGIYGSGSPIISNYNVIIANSTAKYGLYLTSSSATLSVTNSTIGNGLYLGAGGFIPTITGNTFSNSDNSPPHAGANIISQILDRNTFNGLTATGRIEVVAEQVNRDVQWKKYAAPYVVQGSFYVYKDTTSSATLTIDPGVTVKFSLYTGLYIGNSSYKGLLVANGTTSQPIIFTSSQAVPAAGNWYGLNLSGNYASASTLNYIVIEYGGYGGSYSSANIYLSSSSTAISNATIRNSAGSGIYMSSAANIPRITDSTITANKWGIYSDNSNPQISNSKIYGNTTAGVWNSSTTADIDARSNWWGAASGPLNATSNPTGAGNSISSKVLFNPWMGQIPNGLSINNAQIIPTVFNPISDSTTISATLSASANWTITITDSSNATVRTFTGSGALINQKWYGDNSLSVKVADGTYAYKIEATNATSSETASTLQGTLQISRQIPNAFFSVPTDNQIFQGGSTINITGTATDSSDFKNYVIEYGTGESPTSWSALTGAITTQVNNSQLFNWNTNGYTNGIYTLRLTVTDNAGNTSSRTVRVRLLAITANAQSQNYISPNNDSIQDSTTITATATWPSNWSIAILNNSNALVRTLNATNTSSITIAWDGKDSSGTVVPDGTYTYSIVAADPTSGVYTLAKTGSLISDKTVPSVSISSPASGGLLRNTVTVTGTASDANITSYTLDYGPSSGTGPWTVINSGTTAITTATLGTWITNDQGGSVPLANGSYQLRLAVIDKAGNSAGFMIPVTGDNLNLSNITASSKTINTDTAGTSTVSFSINAPATVTFKIIPEKQGANGTPIYQSSKVFTAAGSSSFTWDGKDSTSKVVPDEAYLYTISATDGIKADTYSPAIPAGTGTVTCNQNKYNPASNIPMTITYNPVQPCRLNIFISWGGQNFKIMDAQPSFASTGTIDWDGRTPAGKLLDSNALSTCAIASLMPENHIITTGNTPRVTMLKTDPYQISLAYGQFARIKYTINKQSNVTIKLVSPSGTAAVLVNNLLQTAGSYEMEWTSADLTDENGKTFLVSEDGDYAVTVQVTNPVTGASSITRGNLRLGL